jgi:Flp pilus assembly pilin Flp
MRQALRFLLDESAQDLIEYTLLITFIALGSAAILLNVGVSTRPIWNSTSAQLVNAASVASS